MSAFIVNDSTIHAIVKGFEIYNATFKAEGYSESPQILIGIQNLRNGIGQTLLEQNYKSVNYRYNEETATPKYNYKDVEIDAGVLLGCIDCYIYQACETDDFFESDLYYSLQRLKNAMLERFISNAGYNVPWGYEEA